MRGRPGAWRTAVVLGLHALAVWALCGATIALGRAFLPMQATLVVHAILAPIFAAAASWAYSSRFGYPGPLASATVFLAFIAGLDLFVVALLIERSLDMFRSALGTWIPFALIFLAALAAGLIRARTRAPPRGAAPPAPGAAWSPASEGASSRRS